MNLNLDIKSEHLSIIQKILRKRLPEHAKVWVFGSRARLDPKKYSDLDLALDIGVGNRISVDIISDLMYEFEESDLPYKVDIVDLSALSNEFRIAIGESKIELER